MSTHGRMKQQVFSGALQNPDYLSSTSAGSPSPHSPPCARAELQIRISDGRIFCISKTDCAGLFSLYYNIYTNRMIMKGLGNITTKT